MSRAAPLTRRSALAVAAAAGVSVSFLGRSAFADSEQDLARRKLVVIVCRGAMDGLSVSPPVGDPNYVPLRGALAIGGFGQPGGALQLDETFGLHPKLAAVYALAQKGQARIAPAVATPDRARSHFEAQDVLESGAAAVYGETSGWLNRAMEAARPRKIEALSVGAQAPLILRGRIEAASWSPGGYKDRDLRLPGILADLYAHDPLLGPALASGLQTEAMAKIATAEASPPPAMAVAAPVPNAPGGPSATPAAAQAARQVQAQAARNAVDAARTLGATLADFMTQPNGPQIAAISIDGFDTHAGQGAAEGQLANRLAYLDAVIDGLHSGLGPEWRNTVVVAATEFGRTAHANGTGGTDHGTASTALIAGGGLKAGGLIGD
ncbi:MAG: DUF1501 domain-containing protein, partial [Caulobacteraceae bacterium]|nr:DUF1501 domain-containing protein [Caulobacteraceae bacterium]